MRDFTLGWLALWMMASDGGDEMKLVMTLKVRDEDDVLEENLRFHRALGVDFFIVTDNGSVDRTPEILARYAHAGTKLAERRAGVRPGALLRGARRHFRRWRAGRAWPLPEPEGSAVRESRPRRAATR